MSRSVAVSKIGVRSQTVVPKSVRQALNVRPGDRIAFVIDKGRVEVRKDQPATDNPFACFDEWSGEADSKGYAGL
jgi:antitoxin PrlF